jgi:predicted hydrocarbon binding protein
MSFRLKSAINILWQKMFYLIDNDLPVIRPTLGNYVKTIETQKRLDYVVLYNPNIARIEYQSILNGTKNNVQEQHEKKGLDSRILRNLKQKDPKKFSQILHILNQNIYGPLFQKMGKGYGTFQSLDIESRQITYEVKKCDECLGLPDVGSMTCFYFSGLLAGIFSVLFNQSMGTYESSCGMNGEPACNFEIDNIHEMNFCEKLDRYLSFSISNEKLNKVEKVLSKNILESLKAENPSELIVGSNSHIISYQLRILNNLEQNPEIFSETYRKAGVRFSNQIVEILRNFYQVDGEELLKDALPKYYKKQLLANIQSVEKFQDGFLLTISEAIDCTDVNNLDIKPCAFMRGEIEGIATIATGKHMKCHIHSCKYDTGEHLCKLELKYIEEIKDIPDWLKEIEEQ